MTWKERFLGALLDVMAGDRKLDPRERAKPLLSLYELPSPQVRRKAAFAGLAAASDAAYGVLRNPVDAGDIHRR